MDELIKRIIYRLFPEMQQQLHLLQYAQVVGIPSEVSDGQYSDAFEPRYAVNIQMMDKHGVLYGPIIESVPCPLPTASNNRGMMGFPQVGTIVGIQYAYGDPEMPVIVNVYPFKLNLPALKKGETLIQQSSATYLRSKADESWDLRARNKVRIGNADVDLVAEVQRLASILAVHTHPSVGQPIQSAQINAVASNIDKIKS